MRFILFIELNYKIHGLHISIHECSINLRESVKKNTSLSFKEIFCSIFLLTNKEGALT